MADINEKTRIPLYHAVSLWVVIIGIGTWAGSISSNQATQGDRQDRFADAIRSDRRDQIEERRQNNKFQRDVIDRLGHIEGALDYIKKHQ